MYPSTPIVSPSTIACIYIGVHVPPIMYTLTSKNSTASYSHGRFCVSAQRCLRKHAWTGAEWTHPSTFRNAVCTAPHKVQLKGESTALCHNKVAEARRRTCMTCFVESLEK